MTRNGGAMTKTMLFGVALLTAGAIAFVASIVATERATSSAGTDVQSVVVQPAQARIAPNVAFRSVDPGKPLSFTFTANDPGVFMHHCGTAPVFAHIANGMYGAIVVDPKTPLRPTAHEHVLVAGE